MGITSYILIIYYLDRCLQNVFVGQVVNLAHDEVPGLQLVAHLPLQPGLQMTLQLLGLVRIPENDVADRLAKHNPLLTNFIIKRSGKNNGAGIKELRANCFEILSGFFLALALAAEVITPCLGL